MSGIYIHIPYCRQSCIYCNFYFNNGLKGSDLLIDSLLREIDIRLNKSPFDIETLYFGGGTPSFVDAKSIHLLIDKVKSISNQTEFKELTLEANPDDMTSEKLVQWKKMGVSRLSVGVQSFFDDHLKWMNRAHSSNEAVDALKMAADMGFELSLDLIFGIPNATNQQHLENLEKALSFNIQHLSCYGLTLEENTPWKKLIQTKSYPSPNESLASEQFELTMSFMKANAWEHYEISNYALPGKMALHNTSYWQGKPYIGIGPSAHSYDGVNRSWNVSDIKQYCENINQGILPSESEVLTIENKFNEYVMTGLRTQWGIQFEKLKAFNLDLKPFIQNLEKQKELGFVIEENQLILLTQKGKQFADAIASSLFV